MSAKTARRIYCGLQECRKCFEGPGEKIKGLSKAAKMRTDAAVSLNLLLGRSDSHVAQMMMTGSTMGVVNAEKKLTKYENAEASAKALMQHLSDFEFSTVEKMKPFL